VSRLQASTDIQSQLFPGVSYHLTNWNGIILDFTVLLLLLLLLMLLRERLILVVIAVLASNRPGIRDFGARGSSTGNQNDFSTSIIENRR
jgi:hypothetical protein